MPLFTPYTEAISAINKFQQSGIPYIFILDFSKTHGFCSALQELNSEQILYHIGITDPRPLPFPLDFRINPMTRPEYKNQFDHVMNEIQEGNTYLTNLTVSTPIICNLDLLQLYQYSSAKYKLWIRDEFTVFSPECFIRIKNNEIFTYPMKGTLPADQPDAENILREDTKEDAEHYTIIDLLRNDLNMVSNQVQVSKFKQIERIQTHKGPLLQMSSEIKGKIKDPFKSNFGNLLDLLLPAGSITGAPKKSTVEIIQRYEKHQRGFYTGIFGVGNGDELESAVMIRYIEKKGNQLIFKSGGGITSDSDLNIEYQEFINKVYVPIF